VAESRSLPTAPTEPSSKHLASILAPAGASDIPSIRYISRFTSRFRGAVETTGGALRSRAASGMASLLPGQAALRSQHVYFGNERDRLGTPRCESKQDPGRSLVRWQHAMKDHWLVDDMAAPKVADRDDQRHAAVAVAKRKLARFRPSAAVASFGMCPEPELIKADDLVQWACHDDRDLPSGKECGQPPCRPHQVRSEENVRRPNLIYDR
jgi:hypothetical protein